MRRKVRRTSRTIATANAVLSIVVIVVMSASAQASPLKPTQARPYSGTWASSVSDWSTGCGTRSVVQPVMTFNLTSGVAYFSQRSSASDQGCKALPPYTTANASAFLTFVTNSFNLSTGSHTVASTWTVDWAAQITNFTRSPSDPPAACEVFSISSYLTDAAGNGWGWDTWSPGATCDNLGNVTVSGVDRFTIYSNITLTSSKTLQVVEQLQIFTGAFISALGNSASASVNEGTHGHYAKLDSIVIH